MQSWYVIQTKPRREIQAQENLQRQGYKCYMPMMREKLYCRGRYKIRTEPMFPRYLFIQLDILSDNTASIRSTFGVNGLVRFGNHIPALPDEFIETLSLSTNTEDGCIERDLKVNWRAGDKLLITDGPLAGWEAIFKAEYGHDRVQILINLLGQQRIVYISEHQLVAS